MTTARGLRSNNPGNLRASPLPWQGQTGIDPNGFCTFDSAENGLRAACKQLLTYQTRYGLGTISVIVSRWAPPTENDTAAYIAAVAKETGIGADTTLSLHAAPVLAALCTAIVRHENGQQPYPTAMILAAAGVALGVVPVVPAPVPVPVPAVLKPPVPAPKVRDPETLTGVPAVELDKLVRQFKAEGATVYVSSQPDGTYTVVTRYN